MQPPACKFGYPESQLEEILGPERLKEFYVWMIGQTFGECSGELYSYELAQYYDSGCGPHGFVYYGWDVLRFLNGQPVID